jgi:D-alanyl-D-alanine carboxypeptidase
MSGTPTQTKTPRLARGRILAAAVALTAVTGLVMAAAPAASAAAVGPGRAGEAVQDLVRQVANESVPEELAALRDAVKRNHRPDAVQKTLDGLVKNDKFPGALAAVRDAKGRTRHYTAGVGDLKTKSRVPVDGQVRIASNTKMFTAVVVLQLVGEGRIELDAPVETYLPELVRGEGGDGREITVRQILQHTSGLADYDVALVGEDYGKVRHTYFEPQQLLDAALGEKALFAPGKGWSYSNANYVLAGLIIEKVTGRTISQEITTRIIKRIGLKHTYWPAKRDQTIRERHPRGYFPTAAGGPMTDVTRNDPSMSWAAGQLIGTPSDLNRFMIALLNGKLLKPAQLKQMQTTVKADDFNATGGAGYGLGLATFKLSCGGFAWTHGGDSPGYVTRNGVTKDGRAATIAFTAPPTSLPTAQRIEASVDTALCQK